MHHTGRQVPAAAELFPGAPSNRHPAGKQPGQGAEGSAHCPLCFYTQNNTVAAVVNRDLSGTSAGAVLPVRPAAGRLFGRPSTQ